MSEHPNSVDAHRRDLEKRLNSDPDFLRAVSGDEHPSGLRDAIVAMEKSVGCLAVELPGEVWDDVHARWNAVRSALSVVSEEEIDAAAEALCRFNVDPPDTDYTVEDDFQHMARVALAASRRVLVPRIESARSADLRPGTRVRHRDGTVAVLDRRKEPEHLPGWWCADGGGGLADFVLDDPDCPWTVLPD